jgi:hypothetical protein
VPDRRALTLPDRGKAGDHPFSRSPARPRLAAERKMGLTPFLLNGFAKGALGYQIDIHGASTSGHCDAVGQGT